MARFNELLVGRYNRLAQKLFSMKGPSAVNQLDNSVQLGVPLMHGEENRYLEAWDMFGRAQFQTPSAGNASAEVLRNPVGSNVVAVCTRVAASQAAADNFLLTLFRPGSAGSTVDQPTARAAQGWDPRGRPASTCIVSDNNGAAVTAQVGGVLIYAGFTPANTVAEIVPPGREIPLLPGSALLITNGLLATQIEYCFWWRERFLEDSERA